MSTASVVKHQLKHKEDQPRQKRFKVGKACFTCRVKKIKCDGLQPCMQCKARSRPCSFSKDGEGEEEEEEEEEFNSPVVSPIIDSPTTKKIRHSNTMANSIIATEILNRLNKIIPGEGREGKWELDNQRLTVHNTKITECKQPKVDLPSKPIQQHLIQLYFKHCYSTFPIIPKRLFFKQFESSTRKLLTSPILLLMIFAHGAQYQQKSIMDADLYFKQAKMLLDYELNNPNQSTIIALALMSLFETGNNQCNTMYCVMAIQLCFDLDLLKNYTSEFIELRKRICWSCYYLDKLIHFQLGQPWMLKSKDIKLDMPLLQPGDDVTEHEILEGFVSVIKLLQITEKNQYQQQSDELTNWLRSLPLHLQSDSLTNRLTCQLHLLYNFIELSVLKPYSFGATKPNQQKSITIATNLTRLITILVTNQTWIFNYNFTTFALFESIKIHLKNCGSININTAQHARFMFQQSMQTIQSLLILDQKRNTITSTITTFLTALDQALTDADLSQEDMMTPFVLGSLNARNGVEEERQQWSKLDYFSNGLIHPPVVKSKSNLYYNLPLYNNNNNNNNNYSNHLFQNSWRAQPQPQTQTPAELLLNQTQTSDIAAFVAQIQDTNEGNKSSNASETTTSTPTNNNEDILYSLLSDQQPETQPEPVSEPQQQQQQQQQQRHYNSFSYPYTNVGLGIYASAHQHHNDVIRQHLPNSRSVSMTHQGQVIVATDNHSHQ